MPWLPAFKPAQLCARANFEGLQTLSVVLWFMFSGQAWSMSEPAQQVVRRAWQTGTVKLETCCWTTRQWLLLPTPDLECPCSLVAACADACLRLGGGKQGPQAGELAA